MNGHRLTPQPLVEGWQQWLAWPASHPGQAALALTVTVLAVTGVVLARDRP